MGKSKRETDDCRNADVLVIGGPTDVEMGAQASHIGDDWKGIWKDPPGRQFYDFRSFVFWPTENVFDIPPARVPIDAINDDLGHLGPVPRKYREARRKLFPDLWGDDDKDPSVSAARAFRRGLWGVCRPRVGALIQCAVHGAIVVVVVPEPLVRSPFGQLITLGWLSPMLAAKYSPDTVVDESVTTNMPRSDIGFESILPAWNKIVALYGRMTEGIRVWPSFSLRFCACLQYGVPDQPLYGLRYWGQLLLRWSRDEGMAWEPDMTFGQEFADNVKNVPVFVAPGHCNMAGDPKSMLFVTGQGGIIVLPATMSLPSIVAALGAQRREPPLPPVLIVKSLIICPIKWEKRGKQGKVWVLRVRNGTTGSNVEVTMGLKTFLYFLAFYAATKAGSSGLDPLKPMVGVWSIPANIFPAKTDKDNIGKPAQQVNDEFHDLGPSSSNVVIACSSSGGHRRYAFNYDSFDLDWSALEESDDPAVNQMLRHLR